MLPEEFYENLANEIYNEFQAVESHALLLISEQLAIIKAADDAELMKLGKKAAKAVVVDRIQKELDKVVEKSDNIIYHTLKTASVAEYADMAADFPKLPPFNRQKAINDILVRVSSETSETVRNYSKTTGFVNSREVWQPLHKFYSDSIDDAIKAVRLGEDTYREASEKIVKNMADSGLSFGVNKDGSSIVEYPSGYKRRLDSSIRNAVTGGQQRMSADQAEIMAKEIGADAWQINFLYDSAADHEFLNGRFYTQEEFEKQDIDSHLGRYGCRHRKISAVAGISEPNWTDAELDKMNAEARVKKPYGGKEYAAADVRDRKRKLETVIRRQKDRIMSLDKAGLDTKNELAKLKIAQAEYNSFTKAMGVKKEPNRVSVVGFGKWQNYVK